ncbi:DUF1631 family protein [Ramlibacter terrae]|uniref:DUF1631 family protein n=1 Tax=Ramlibacter terrae TaxID=2732511 RepID=A0ABX6P311_9BURK|nr:DUF1631 family protein [Ramlibacter terrae]
MLREQQHALAEAFPTALLAEFARAIAGDRASTLGFDALPLLGDEQLQENVDWCGRRRSCRNSSSARSPSSRHCWAPPSSPAPPASGIRCGPRCTCARWSGWRARAPFPPPCAAAGCATCRPRWVPNSRAAMRSGRRRCRRRAGRCAGVAHAGAGGAGAGRPGHPADHPRAAQAAGGRTAAAGGRRGRAGRRARHRIRAHRASRLAGAARHAQGRPVLQQLRQRQAAVPGRPSDSRALFREALRREAKRPAQALGLEVVHLMVENLAGDIRLLPPVQEAVRDLEPALLRLALEDPRFFSDRTHPARQLLEQVTERSLGWGATDAPGFREFIDGLQQAVEALLETRATGAQPFEIALDTLRESWSDAQPRGRRGRERAVRALLRAEQRNLLADRIAAQVRERPDAGRRPTRRWPSCAARGRR